jgi:hypothetical protein
MPKSFQQTSFTSDDEETGGGGTDNDNASTGTRESLVFYQRVQPDSPYSWLLCGITFFLIFMFFGFLFSAGVFLEAVSETFDTPIQYVSLVFSSTFGFSLVISPHLTNQNKRNTLRLANQHVH